MCIVSALLCCAVITWGRGHLRAGNGPAELFIPPLPVSCEFDLSLLLGTMLLSLFHQGFISKVLKHTFKDAWGEPRATCCKAQRRSRSQQHKAPCVWERGRSHHGAMEGSWHRASQASVLMWQMLLGC